MKKLLVVLLALALPVAADGPVVCSETPQSPGTSCSAAVQSSTNCVCVAAEAGSAEPSVYDDAVSLWRLDEASGTRADSIGSNDLTDNNTVGYANAGPQGVVASAVAANSEYLSRANMELPASYTLSMWVEGFDGYPGNPVNGGVLFFAGSSYPDGTAGLGTNGGYYGSFLYSRAGESQQAQPFYSNWVPYDEGNRWRFITYDYNASTRVGRIWIDNRPAPVVGDALTAAAHRGASDVFHLFGSNGTSVPGWLYSTNRFGPVGLWSEVLDDAKRLSIFNAGAAKLYSDLSDSDKTNLVSYWNMSEPSGTRYDSHGTNHLTDNNTVGSTTNSYPANLPGTVASFVAANSESLTGTAIAEMTDGFTWSAWVNVGNSTRWGLVNNGINASPYGFTVEVNVFGAGDILVFATSNGAEYVYTGTGALTVDGSTWHLLTIVYDTSESSAAAKCKVFVDGVSQTMNTSAGTPVAHTVGNAFGLGRRATDRYYQGLMSAVAVWDRALSADDITALYNSGAGAPLP